MANQIVDFTDSNNNIINSRTRYLENLGIYDWNKYWSNSNNVLLLDAKYNGGIFRISGTSGTQGVNYPSNLPSALQNITTIVFRQQMATYANGALAHAVVILYEVHPTPGRIWVNCYNVGWKGWKSVTLS